MDDNLHVQIEADPMDSFIPHKISVVYYAKQPVDTVDLIARLRTNDSNPVLDQIYLQLPTEIPNLSPLDQDPTTFAVYLLFKWIKNSTTDFYRGMLFERKRFNGTFDQRIFDVLNQLFEFTDDEICELKMKGIIDVDEN